MAQPDRAPRAGALATRERILRSSERLFARHGYSGTSLRAIADDAGVNLAAAHYHFGSKRALLQSAFMRSVEPVNDARLQNLDALEAREPSPTVEQVVRAFIEPVFVRLNERGYPPLLARVFAEPKSVSVPLLEDTFRPVASRFIAALATALPELSMNELGRRFHCMVGAMVHVAQFREPLDLFDVESGSAPAPGANGVDWLIDFVVAGLCQRQPAGVSH